MSRLDSSTLLSRSYSFFRGVDIEAIVDNGLSIGSIAVSFSSPETLIISARISKRELTEKKIDAADDLLFDDKFTGSDDNLGFYETNSDVDGYNTLNVTGLNPVDLNV